MELIKKGAQQYKANLHCHSNISDGSLTPEELKRAYKERGYSVLAITDHEYPYDHTAMSEEDFLMLTGYEAYIRVREDGVADPFKPEIHINLLARDPHNTSFVGYNDCYCRYESDPAVRAAFKKVGSQRQREYSVEYINEFVKCALNNGYICTHNHPYWSLEDWGQILEYDGFFSMEMCNYSSYLINGIEYNAQLYDYLLRNGKRLCCHSADDNHNKNPLDMPTSDSFGGFTMILADSLDYSSVFSALEKGNFYSSMGPMFKEVTIEGGHVHIECDPVRQITMYNGSKGTCRALGTVDEPVTVADFDIPEGSLYVRISAVDFLGRYADTRAVFPDEL